MSTRPANGAAPLRSLGRRRHGQDRRHADGGGGANAFGRCGPRLIDKTGLTGNYELTLRYSGQVVNGAERPAEELPSIFTAVQEQLGLKLEADRAPLQLVVVERIERPTED